MQKINWNSAYKLVAVICLTVVTEVIVIAISEMNNVWFWLFSGILSLFASLAIVQVSVTGIEKIVKWRKTPNPKNISLSCLQLTNNEIRLKVKNLEFRKPQTIISKIEIGISGQKNWLSVIHNNSVLKFLKSVEVPFIKLNPKENTFSVIYPENEELEKFGFGVYKFDVVIQYGFSTPREGLLSRYVVIVEFSGGLLKIVSLLTPAT